MHLNERLGIVLVKHLVLFPVVQLLLMLLYICRYLSSLAVAESRVEDPLDSLIGTCDTPTCHTSLVSS